MVCDSHFDNICQIELFLGVVVFELWQPLLEPLGRHGHDAAVSLFDFTLQLISIFMLNDVVDLMVKPAHDTPITSGIFKVDGEQSQVFSIAGLDQGS